MTANPQKTNIPQIPVSGKEYLAIQHLFADASALVELTPIIRKRAQLVPGLWRDLCMLKTKSQKVLEQIIDTVPMKKRQHMLKDIKNTNIYIRVEAPGIKTVKDKSFSYLPTDALNALLNHLLQQECAWCDKTGKEGRSCPYRKMIEDALPHTVGREEDGEHCKYSDIVLGLDEQ